MTDRTIPNTAALNGWRKSSHSDDNGGSCLEVLDDHPSGVPVRDSKNPHGPALVFSKESWSSFTVAVKSREFTV
ncbi:DUF397 domain-containing protein [Streptomyces ipomoeae]|uniref:DUF397 domain-containing protein n=1 Tax=Streptomyces ipomoeae TaxID=103232 RepID=UPI0011476B87|nr:DUF397 domain-containing protein [Streptomyces ipomoeae]MDX2825322.1 DUF397 domain-containing protein [Streptomyces ipomoeae]MDX2825325.1 DUF397 domain-containing protein [Streptomyces ipomoeae]MDX2879926.1 DUF397 domain-containing protein [Streptomyces ipomoeae]TQE20106.1 DUF397 domain-containing protein [Streptomyces ipomoeae]